MSSPDFDAVIIGGGHNGLVCAGYLARNGWKVLVLERRPFVGGAAATEELFSGYRLSSCSYICHLLQAKVIDDLHLRQHGFEVFHLDPSRIQPYPDGQCLTVWDSIEQTQASIAQFSQRDAQSFPGWLKFWERAAGLLYPYFLTAPPTLVQLRESLNSDDAAFLEALLRVSMKDLVRQFFEDEAVRGAFIQAQDVGDPAAAGSAWCYTLIRCDAFSRPQDVGIVKGGMGSVSQALAASAEQAGVTIRTDATVEEILVRDGTAVGVRMLDGSEITSRVTISNADPKTTLLKLVDSDDLPDDFTGRISQLKTRVGYLKFHAALSRLPDFSQFFPGGFEESWLASMKICPSIEYFEQSWHEAVAGSPAQQPVMEVQIPSVVDPTLAPPGHHVMSVWGLYAPVQPANGTWDDLREETGQRLIDELSHYAPDLRDCLVDWSLFTPADIERRGGMTDGNIRHLDVIPEQFLSDRPLSGWADYGTPIDGLYLCGAGTHPGGEVTGAPGHNAAHRLLAGSGQSPRS